jgi:hypothetical protein
MQRDAVAFAVQHDRAEPVGADRMHGLLHLPAALLDLGDCITDAPVDIEIDEDSAGGADLAGAGDQAAAVTLVMREKQKAKPSNSCFCTSISSTAR